MEEYNPKKRFKEYEKEKKGQPIDPLAIEAGKKEIEQGRKGDYAVYGDEPDRAKLIASYPKGELGKENTETEEVSEQPSNTDNAISELSKMKEMVEKYDSKADSMEKELKDAISELTETQKFIVSFLEKEETEKFKMQNEMISVVTKISGKYRFKNERDGLKGFLEEIGEFIDRYTEFLKYFHSKPSE